jgi:hypothetical protein
MDLVERSRPRVGTWVALVVAGLWGLGLLVAAVTVPVSSGSTVGASGVVESSATLVEENGDGVLAIVAIPLVVSLGVALALVHRYQTSRPGPGVVAPVLTGLVLILCLLGMLTIGVFMLPVAISLVVACALAS